MASRTALATGSGHERVLRLCGVPGQELDRRFRAGAAGDLPESPLVGAVLVLTGTPLARPVAHLIRAFAWQGKVVPAGRGELVNRVLPFRIEAVRAKICRGQSWFDGRPCIVVDYSRTSLVAAMVRDELREIEPRLWLGFAYMRRVRVFRFALACDPASASAARLGPAPDPPRRRPGRGC